jgi:hypothetical protein
MQFSLLPKHLEALEKAYHGMNLTLNEAGMRELSALFTRYLTSASTIRASDHRINALVAACAYHTVGSSRTLESIALAMSVGAGDVMNAYKAVCCVLDIQREQLGADGGFSAARAALGLSGCPAGMQLKRACWRLYDRALRTPGAEERLAQFNPAKMYAVIAYMVTRMLKLRELRGIDTLHMLDVTPPTVRKIEAVVQALVRGVSGM